MQVDITLVTALYDLNRHELDNEFSRSFEHYIECFKKLLTTCIDIPMLIYCDSEEVTQIVKSIRNDNNTKIVKKSLNELLSAEFVEKINQIRTDKKWYRQSPWLKGSPQCSLDWYSVLVHSKQFLLNDATLYNYFDTSRFFWIDAGISNTCSPSYLSDQHIQKLLNKETRNNKMLYLCFTYEGTVEVHGFSKEAMNLYANEETRFVVRGGFFGGTKDAINRINGYYYNLLQQTLHDGFMGTEESLFTLLSYMYKHDVNCHTIPSTGLIYNFFEKFKHQTHKEHSGVVIYFLSYNLPEQLKYCLENFQSAHPDFFNKCKKYLLNNSTDGNVIDAYQEIIKKYELEEIRFNNIGICGARQFSATHFDASDYEFMIFFEDDMIMHSENYQHRVCKSGFSTYAKNIFEKSINIIDENDLDYLKLTFSEYYGENHKNWAWYNMSEDDRDQWIYEDSDKNFNSKVFYTNSYKHIPYTVGEYFYCNWPIIFTRRGNRKVFLEKIYERPYEQIWMAETQKKIRMGELRTGCLLLTPLTHERRYHYNKNSRKES